MDGGGMSLSGSGIPRCVGVPITQREREAVRLLKTASCSLWLPGINSVFHRKNITRAGRPSGDMNETEETVLCGFFYCTDTFGVRTQIIKVFGQCLAHLPRSNRASEANTALAAIPALGYFSAFPPS